MGFYEASGSGANYKHLLEEHQHQLDKNLEKSGPLTTSTNRITTSIQHMSQHFNPQKQQLFVAAFPDWVIMQKLSFHQATSKETVALFQLLRPSPSNLYYLSHTTLSENIQDNYVRRQDEIQLLLAGAQSKIHLSSDLWSAANMLSLLEIVAHFLDMHHNHRTVLLGLPRVFGNHGGVSIADSVLSVTARYGMTDNLSCFVMDNASNNDTMMAALHEAVSSIQGNQRLRCAGHIINLVVKALLDGGGITHFTSKIALRSGGRGDGIEGEVVEAEEDLPQRHNVPASVLKQRAEYRALGIIESDDEEDSFTAGLLIPVPTAPKTTSTSRKQPRTEVPQTPELERWYRYQPTDDFDNPLQCWIDEAKNTPSRFPKLARLALNIFSIPAMSSECERVFSETKQLITDDRNQLGAATIEAVQCQKNWLGNGIVSSSLTTVVAQAEQR